MIDTPQIARPDTIRRAIIASQYRVIGGVIEPDEVIIEKLEQVLEMAMKENAN